MLFSYFVADQLSYLECLFVACIETFKDSWNLNLHIDLNFNKQRFLPVTYLKSAWSVLRTKYYFSSNLLFYTTLHYLWTQDITFTSVDNFIISISLALTLVLIRLSLMIFDEILKREMMNSNKQLRQALFNFTSMTGLTLKAIKYGERNLAIVTAKEFLNMVKQRNEPHSRMKQVFTKAGGKAQLERLSSDMDSLAL